MNLGQLNQVASCGGSGYAPTCENQKPKIDNEIEMLLANIQQYRTNLSLLTDAVEYPTPECGTAKDPGPEPVPTVANLLKDANAEFTSLNARLFGLYDRITRQVGQVKLLP
jgi:hypothetical protein